MAKPWKPVLWTVAVLAALGALAGAAMVYGGLYNIAATAQHTQPVYTVLATAMHNSVELRARDVVVPASLGTPEQLRRGAACYRARCVQCHGGPGAPADAIGMAMQPVPGSLIGAAGHWQARELYWITRHGIKMSGMPAWGYHLSEDELWAVVAFVQRLPDLTPSAYAELMAQLPGPQCRAPARPMVVEPTPEAAPRPMAAEPVPEAVLVERGRLALRMYACHACHAIPGVTGPQPHVGPPLAGFASGLLIAGRLVNTRANLVAWIRHPQRIDPKTAMPDLGVSLQHAREMAAYLSTLTSPP